MPPTSREVALVNSQVAQLFGEMEPRHIALLITKIMQPDKPLITITSELWPDLGYDQRKRIVGQSNVTKVLGMVRDRPWIMAAIIGNKLAPVMVSVLYELALDPETKSNVRATAAKELIRLAQSTASSLASSDSEPLPTEEMDDLLASAESDDELDDGLDEDARDEDEQPLTGDELMQG